MIEQGRRELDNIVVAVSSEICKEHRPRVVELTGKLLECVKKISDLNDQLWELRTALEREGLQTGTLAETIFPIGRWADPHGGRIPEYRKYIRENYPELADKTI